MSNNYQFPRQMLSYSAKGKKWRKDMMDWASSKTFFNCSPVRRSIENKKINYDLVNGIIHMDDIERVLDPDNVKSRLIAKKIQHYPIINSKLEVLRGEESKRVFDYKFVITNPTSVSEVENAKFNMVLQGLTNAIEQSQSEEEMNKQVQELNDFSKYSWQDLREIKVNALIKHYSAEQNFNYLFNRGFMDALTSAEEIYQCDIVGGEPVLAKLNPLKVSVYQSGTSRKIEDADCIIIEDYWSIGKVIDTFYQDLKPKDVEYLESHNNDNEPLNSDGTINEAYPYQVAGYIRDDYMSDISGSNLFDVDASYGESLVPFDIFGNVRVIRLYWKSKRKIKKVKSYNPQTGEEMYNFYTEDYIINKDMGEEEYIYWINQAWEGTKIGENIYVRVRPCPVQFNSISNPSTCHFGIIGSVYNINDSKPYSLVDKMKPFNYLYDVIHDRLNKTMARNWGKLVRLDLAKVPDNWEIDKWLYYAQVNGLAIENSFNAATEGPATGKIAGAMNNASSGVIDADWGNNIQQYIQLLEYIKSEMSEVAGISRQREGQISNRETVGGVERATLQSSHITESLFLEHENVKKRVLECFVEVAKVAMRGGSKKFQYILPDHSRTIIDIDGDDFCEHDYGIVVDNSNNTQKLSQQIDQIAQLALQSQKISLASVMKMYTSASLAEKMHMLEVEEERTQQQMQQMQYQQMESQQQIAQMQAETAQQNLQAQLQMNAENNETKILVAQIAAQSKESLAILDKEGDGIAEPITEEAKAKLEESIRQFNERIKLDRERLEFDKTKANKDADLKLKQINKSNNKKV